MIPFLNPCHCLLFQGQVWLRQLTLSWALRWMHHHLRDFTKSSCRTILFSSSSRETSSDTSTERLNPYSIHLVIYCTSTIELTRWKERKRTRKTSSVQHFTQRWASSPFCQPPSQSSQEWLLFWFRCLQPVGLPRFHPQIITDRNTKQAQSFPCLGRTFASTVIIWRARRSL